MKYSIILVGIIIFGILISGCINSVNTPKEQESSTSTASSESAASTTSTQIAQSNEQIKIKELEDRINSTQQQINELQTRVNRVDLLKPSNKNLIPKVPFRIEIYISEWQTPLTYVFKEGGQAELRGGDFNEIAQYNLFANNNTIKIDSKKYDYYGLVLYDDYAAAIYENGWIDWVRKYKVFPPKYNPITQMYELD